MIRSEFYKNMHNLLKKIKKIVLYMYDTPRMLR